MPVAFSSFGTFLLRQFFLSIPQELEDAARIDGASHLRILLTIFLPLSLPALGLLALFTFTGQWNSFLWPLIAVNGPDHATFPLGLTHVPGPAGHAVELHDGRSHDFDGARPVPDDPDAPLHLQEHRDRFGLRRPLSAGGSAGWTYRCSSCRADDREVRRCGVSMHSRQLRLPHLVGEVSYHPSRSWSRWRIRAVDCVEGVETT